MPTTPPKVPAGAHQKTDAGAKAYAGHVLRTYWYAMARQDLEPILALTTDRTCPTCKETAQLFAAPKKTVEMPEGRPQVDKATIYLKESNIWHVSVRYDQPDGTRYFTDDREPEPIDGQENDVMEMDLGWQNGKWHMLQYRFPDEEDSSARRSPSDG